MFCGVFCGVLCFFVVFSATPDELSNYCMIYEEQIEHFNQLSE